MNEELQKQIAAILKQALEAAQHGGQWLAGQIPDVLQQLILWNIWVGIIAGLAFAFTLTAGLFVTFKFTDQSPIPSGYNEGDWRASKKASAIIFSALNVVTGTIFLCNFPDALKAAIAPKLFLLEYAAHLVR